MSDNLQDLIDKLQRADLTDPAAPRVVFPSSLSLDRLSEDKLCDHVKDWFKKLEQDTGRTEAMSVNWTTGEVGGHFDRGDAALTFMGRRHLHEMRWGDRLEFRKHLYGGMFGTDVNLPTDRKVAMQQIARATNYFFGTAPWMSVSPVGKADEELSMKVERWTRHKIDKSKCAERARDAIETAFIINEAIVRPSYRRDISYYRCSKPVLIDGLTNEPVVALDGDYIFEDDKEIAVPAVDSLGQVLLSEDGVTPQTMMVLKRDGKTQLPPGQRFYESRGVMRGMKTFDGPDLQIINFRDFMAPMDAPDLASAMCLVHIYDMPKVSLIERFLKAHNGINSDDDLRRLQPLLDLIGNGEISGDRAAAHAQASSNNAYGNSSSNDKVQPMVQLAEFNVWYDADGDGRLEDVCVIVNRETWAPLFYEYIPNITPDGKREFKVLCSQKVVNRWYGTGTMEKFDRLQRGVDLQYARYDFAQSTSGRVTLVKGNYITEMDNDSMLKINGGEIYHLKPNAPPANEIIQTVPLVDMKSESHFQHIEMLNQAMMSMSGVQGVNDAGMAGLDTTKLATGIKNLEANGEELFGFHLDHLQGGMRSIMQAAVALTLANLDEEETFKFFEGENAVLDTITPDEVAGLDLDVTIELSRYKNQQLMVQIGKAKEVFKDFYMLPPQLQEIAAPLYRHELAIYEIPNADMLIVPQMMPPPMQNPVDASAPV